MAMGLGLTVSIASLRVFGNERVVFWREAAFIDVSAYFISKNIVELPRIAGALLVTCMYCEQSNHTNLNLSPLLSEYRAHAVFRACLVSDCHSKLGVGLLLGLLQLRHVCNIWVCLLCFDCAQPTKSSAVHGHLRSRSCNVLGSRDYFRIKFQRQPVFHDSELPQHHAMAERAYLFAPGLFAFTSLAHAATLLHERG
jgi:hypothetical protein